MKKLNRLMDFLPYYFKDKDTYKDSNGKGLLEKYLEIFGNYFEDIIVTDVKSLDGIIDIDHTPSIYLSYLWEFLGKLPYANPQSVDPDKWKAYFNGFNSDSVISSMSKYWLYPKDTVNYDLNLRESDVRRLLKYSITLFKIRGTHKFFKTLLALYGVDIDILESLPSPTVETEEDGDEDYWGTDTDYYGTDDDYGGMLESYYDSKDRVTQLDSDDATLNENYTMDHVSTCNTCASIHFRLHIPNSQWSLRYSNEKVLLDFISKIEGIIKKFLPLNVRAIFDWVSPSGEPYRVNSKTLRTLVFIDKEHALNDAYFYDSGDNKLSKVFNIYGGQPDWMVYYPDTLQNLRYYASGTGTYKESHTKLSELNWPIGTKIRIMVLVLPVNQNGSTVNTKLDSELDPIRFTVNDGNIEYESGHIFDITIGASKTPITFNPKPVLLDKNWKPWYDEDLPVTFNGLLNRVSYKFNVDYNSTVKVNFDYGDVGQIPIISYKEVASIVNGQIISTVSSPVKFISLNNKQEYTPTPIPNDPTRYRRVVNVSTAGIQSFYMVENPSHIIDIETTINRLHTKVSPKPDIAHITNDEPSRNVRLDVRLAGTDSTDIQIPYVMGAPEIDDEEWFDSNVEATYDRGYSGAYFSGQYSVNTPRDVDDNKTLILRIPVLANPVHNNSQFLEFRCEGSIYDGADDIRIILIARVNLLIGIISYTQYNVDDFDEVLDTKTGIASLYGTINKYYKIISVEEIVDSGIPKGYKLIEVKFNIGILIHGYRSLIVYPDVFSWNIETLTYSEFIIRSINNRNLQFNIGELAKFSKPGIYEFKASYYNDGNFNMVDASIGFLEIESTITSGIKYTLEIMDEDRTDNHADTIRMPYEFVNTEARKASILVNMNLFTNLNQVDGIDLETQFPQYFDWDIEIIWGSNPMGTLLASLTLDDDSYNEVTDPYTGIRRPAEHYGKTGYFVFEFNRNEDGVRDYTPSNSNFPPGLYTIAMHSRSPMEGQDFYQVIELYESQNPNLRQIHLDVDVISMAWLNPVGINGNIDGRRTWGYYKSHLESMVTNASYDVHIEIPEFRVLLSNNNVGYKKVWLYKSLPKDSYNEDEDMISGNINYRDIIYGDDPDEQAVPTKSPGEGRAWIFTGTVYDIDTLVKGPEEPGSYMLVVHQTIADNVTIGKAYLEVKELANYRLSVNPTAAVLESEDTAVSTVIDVINDSIWPKKIRLYSEFDNKWVNLDGTNIESQTVFPVTYLAYTAGIYNFSVYAYDPENTAPDPTDSSRSTHWIPLSNTLGLLKGTFNVVRNTTLSPETRTWAWDSEDILTVDLVMVNSESQIPWIATISEDQ